MKKFFTEVGRRTIVFMSWLFGFLFLAIALINFCFSVLQHKWFMGKLCWLFSKPICGYAVYDYMNFLTDKGFAGVFVIISVIFFALTILAFRKTGKLAKK